MKDLLNKIEETRSFLRFKSQMEPEVGIILGTGLGALVNNVKVEKTIQYEEIPNFVKSTLEFHAGKWITGTLSGVPVAIMQGRFHFYEGYSMDEITFPVRLMRSLGIKNLIISNAAGGLNPSFEAGDIMAITDHINLLGQNPLIGKNYDELGPRFPDMSEPYSREFAGRIQAIANRNGLTVHQGVYACMSGPSLETAAEYRMLRTLGADAIGMSTVPEVIVAAHAGIRVLGMSVITDLCDPDHLKPANIREIIRTAAKTEPSLVKLIAEFVKEI